jgi:hypothetical protein
MIEYVTRIDNFWKDDLANYTYVRNVPFVAKNFDHLDRTYYNKDHILQSFDDELPNAQQFKDALNVTNGTVGWICIEPDVILPTHKDTFYTMRQTYNVSVEQCFRYLVFLEDWQFGHYVGFTNKNITNWKAGDVYKFDSTELHYAVNASNSHFHTCQVSTFKD